MTFHRRAGAMLVALNLIAPAAAQPPERPCEIQPFRGATSPAGADVDASMVNRGQSCRFVNYGLPDQRANPAHSGRITVPPRHGVAAFDAPEAVYTPHRGFAGEDEFTYEAATTGRGGAALRMLVRVRIVVAAPR